MSRGNAAQLEQSQKAARCFIDSIADLVIEDPGSAARLISGVLEEAGAILSFANIKVRKDTNETKQRPAPHSFAHAEELGRNQRSRIRELLILDVIQQHSGPCSLSKVVQELASRNFADTQASIVSHLHRLKSAEFIVQPMVGFYEVTESGESHAKRLRAALGLSID